MERCERISKLLYNMCTLFEDNYNSIMQKIWGPVDVNDRGYKYSRCYQMEKKYESKNGKVGEFYGYLDNNNKKKVREFCASQFNETEDDVGEALNMSCWFYDNVGFGEFYDMIGMYSASTYVNENTKFEHEFYSLSEEKRKIIWEKWEGETIYTSEGEYSGKINSIDCLIN